MDKKRKLCNRYVNPRTRRMLIMACGPEEREDNKSPESCINERNRKKLQSNCKNITLARVLPKSPRAKTSVVLDVSDEESTTSNKNCSISHVSASCEDPGLELSVDSENQNTSNNTYSISHVSDSRGGDSLDIEPDLELPVVPESQNDSNKYSPEFMALGNVKSGHNLRYPKRQNHFVEDSETDEDFSPDVSEYLPSPERAESLYGELINENMKTPSAISNISNFFSTLSSPALNNENINNGMPRQASSVNVETQESPKTFSDLDPQETSTLQALHDSGERNVDHLEPPINSDNLNNEDDLINTEQMNSNETPKILTRKRKRNTNDWQDAKNKKLKNSGKAYISVRSKVPRPVKTIREVCSCKKKCYEAFTEEERVAIFNQFWNIADHERQWLYIVRYVVSNDIKRLSLTRRNNRTQTLSYQLPRSGEPIVVCKKFFLNTLSIGDTFVYTALEKGKANSTITDNRGVHCNRPRKMKEDTEQSIITHISLFPVKESHYVRKETKRLYLHEDVKSIRNMYRLYKEWFIEFSKDHQEVKEASRRQYETIFNTRFNYSFFKPKKDMCSTCALYNEADEARKVELEENYQAHILRKEYVRNIKKTEKEQSNPMTTTVATFDLEKVLNIPQSNVGVFHYKRKYPVYDFTIHNSLTKKGYCYVWHLQIAKRGAIEIGSCLLKFIQQEQNRGINSFSFYSDSCPGQNKNRFIFALYVYISKKNSVNITHRFFEVGHSQSEVDSMHSCVERAKNNKIIYTPDQMYGIIMNAKTDGQKYELKEMQQADFFDIKLLVDGKNWDRDNNNEKVKWSLVKEVSVSSTKPDQLMFKYDFTEDCRTVNTETATRPSRGSARLPRGKTFATAPGSSSAGLGSDTEATSILQNLKPAYNQLLPVPKALYNDLMSLCRIEAIPRHYQGFYESLNCDNNNEEADSEEES